MIMTPNFKYDRPNTLKSATKILTEKSAMIHAGGTDLMGLMREGIDSPERIVSLREIKDLRGVEKDSNGGLKLGAMTTISEVADNKLVKEVYPGLSQAASEVASPQLRNQGTIGGNLCQRPRCWYFRGDFFCSRKGGGKCFAFEGENQFHGIFGSGQKCAIVHPSDTAPMLKALRAKVVIMGPSGTRKVTIEDFHVLPKDNVEKETILKQGEMVTHILVPAVSRSMKTSYRKVRARRSWDFAIAGCALALEMEGKKAIKASVVLSGAAPIPWRSKPVEEVITGAKLDEKTISKAAQAVVEDAEPLSKNDYKIPLFKAVIEEELTKMAQ
jgi:xanthine dehydrogenase YagS FAD-binding subunit